MTLIYHEVKQILYNILLLFAVSFRVNGQASATVTANIIAPTAMSKTFESFSGKVPITSLEESSNHASGLNSKTKLRKKNRKEIDVPAASFALSENPDFTYSVSLPDKPLIVMKGDAFITIENFLFTSSESANLSSLQNIHIRATVNLQSSKTGGTYSGSSPMTIVVNYN